MQQSPSRRRIPEVRKQNSFRRYGAPAFSNRTSEGVQSKIPAQSLCIGTVCALAVLWWGTSYLQLLRLSEHQVQCQNISFPVIVQQPVPDLRAATSNIESERATAPSTTTGSSDRAKTKQEFCEVEFYRVTKSNITDHVPGLTEADYERSIAHVGNRYQLSNFVHKLMQSSAVSSIEPILEESPPTIDPVTVVVCGGSITLGHGVEPARARYSDILDVWLNTVFPSAIYDSDKIIREHRVYNRGSHGSDICGMAKRMNFLDLPTQPDLFILEFAVNDYQGQDHVVHLDHKTDVYFEGFQRLAECAEIVICRILMDYPDAAIVFLEFHTAIPNRKTAQSLHEGLAQHYQIPVLSYADVMMPDYYRLIEALKPYNYFLPPNMTGRLEIDFPYPHGCAPCKLEDINDQFRKDGCTSLCSMLKYAKVVPWEDKCVLPTGMEKCYVPMFAHDEVHPSVTGHRIARELIANLIGRTSYDICRGRIFTPYLPPVHGGWIVSSSSSDRSYMDEIRIRSDFVLVKDTMRTFADTDQLLSMQHTSGFELKGDNLGRFGWIATNSSGNESVSFDIDLPIKKCYAVFVSIVKSYKTVGILTATVFDASKNITTVSLDIDCLWSPRISIPVDTANG